MTAPYGLPGTAPPATPRCPFMLRAGLVEQSLGDAGYAEPPKQPAP